VLKFQLSVIACVNAFAARSIKSIDLMGSLSIVYLSNSWTCALVNIFIMVQKYEKIANE
jgi:hypothetical protein